MSSSEFMSAFWDSKFCASGIGACDAERILPSSACFLALVLTLVKNWFHYSFVGVNQPEPISLTFLSNLASLFLFGFEFFTGLGGGWRILDFSEQNDAEQKLAESCFADSSFSVTVSRSFSESIKESMFGCGIDFTTGSRARILLSLMV